MPKCEGSTHHVACDREAEFVVTPYVFLAKPADDFRLCQEHMLFTIRSIRVQSAEVKKIRG